MNSARALPSRQPRWRRGCSAVVVLIGALAAAPGITADPQDECTQPPQPGFRSLGAEEGAWNGSDAFAFVTSGSGVSPLPRLTHRLSDPKLPDSIGIRLDDGSRGALRVTRACQRDDDCPPGDWEKYWLEVRRSQGPVVVRQPLYFAYGAFQIAPIDLVDGPGDELLIAQITAHASPPTGGTLTSGG